MIVGVMTEKGVQKSSPSVYAAGAQNEQSEVYTLFIIKDKIIIKNI